jgi:SAM-dependent methyltransferase
MAFERDKPAMDDVLGGSAERFGYSWHIFSEVLPIHREQFLRWCSALPPEAWRGARFIDVGCGIGRNSLWAMREGASAGVAIDVDDRSLTAARRNLAGISVEVRRESAYDISEVAAFDVAFSIGVIHHLEAPEKALARMVHATKPGGYVLIWVYGRENNGWIVHFFDPLRLSLFARLPLSLVYFLSLFPTAALWCALRLGLQWVEYFRLLSKFSFRHLRAVVFDHMIPRIANYWTREEVDRLMKDAGLEDVRLVWVNDISWSAVGRPPAR